MKNLITKLLRGVVALVFIAVMVNTALAGSVASGSKFYVKESQWSTSGAHLEINFYKGGDASDFIQMTKIVSGTPNVWEVVVPSKISEYDHFNVRRHSSEGTLWNAIYARNIETGNCVEIPAGVWDVKDGESCNLIWSTYSPEFDWYLKSNFTSNWEDFNKFEKQEDGTYQLKLSFSNLGEDKRFGIMRAEKDTRNQNGWYSVVQTVSLTEETVMELGIGNENMIMPKGANGEFTFTITVENNEAKTLKVTPTIVTPEFPEQLWVGGDVNGQSWPEYVKGTQLTYDDTTKQFSGKVRFFRNNGNAYFALFTQNGVHKDDVNYRWGGTVNDTEVTLSTVYGSENKVDVRFKNWNSYVLMSLPSETVEYFVTVDFSDINNVKMWISEENLIPQPTTHTIYFYDNSDSNPTNVSAYTYSGVCPANWKESAVNMTKLDKYVLVGGKYCDVWSYTFDVAAGLADPDAVRFLTDEVESTARVFQSGAFYPADGSSRRTDLALVDKPDENTIPIYFHVKNDVLNDGVKDENGNYEVYCIAYNDAGNKSFAEADYKSHRMFLVDEEHQIYCCNYPTASLNADGNKYLAFCYRRSGDYMWYYSANYDGNESTTEKYTNYIYATGNVADKGSAAIQSWISYDQFDEIVNSKHSKIYLRGDGVTLNGSALSWDNDAYSEINPNGAFYLKLALCEGSNAFKMSLINAGDYRTDSYKSNRDWATFDLGVIGVNDSDSRLNGKFEMQADGQIVYFTMNTSASYISRNQYGWTFKDGTERKDYYLVVDIHPTCKSVTLIDFDPNPKASVTVKAPSTYNIPDDADYFSFHNNDLHACNEWNGHAYFKNVNKVDASVNIDGAGIDNLTNAGFSTSYELYAGDVQDENGNYLALNRLSKTEFAKSAPSAYDVNFASFGGNGTYSTVCEFKDDDTGIMFHSMTSDATVNVDEVSVPAPDAVSELNGYYVVVPEFMGKDEDGKDMYSNTDADGNYHLGLIISGVDGARVSVTRSDLNYYGDVVVDGKSPEFLTADHNAVKYFLENNSVLKSDVSNSMKNWERFSAGTPTIKNWIDVAEEGEKSNNWSRVMTNPDEKVALFVPDYKVVSSLDGLEAGVVNDLVEIFAVYPFISKPGATAVASSVDGAPMRVEAMATDLTGYVVRNRQVGSKVSVKIDASTIITSVKDIEVENADIAPIYFNLQGVRVDNPSNGIFIEVRGNNSRKVAL